MLTAECLVFKDSFPAAWAAELGPKAKLYRFLFALSRITTMWVMSSRLCKKLEGAVFPVEDKSLEDGINNPVHAFHVDKADHGPGSASDFHEATLDNVGGPQLTPQMLRKVEEAQQLRQVLLQLANHGGIGLPPSRGKTAAGRLCFFAAARQIDRLSLTLDLVIVGLTYLLQNIAHLVYPAALMQRPRIDRRNGCRQTRTAIGHNQLQVLALQPAPVQILEQSFPV